MKKTFTGRLRFLVVAMLATITFSFNSCRKDLLVQSPNNLKNALSIAEAKRYFEANVKVSGRTKTSAVSGNIPVTAESLVAGKRAMWEQAYQKFISTGGAVRIPIDFGNTYAVVNLKKGEVVPLSSLNYLLMYKDSLQAIRLEWVMLQPDSAWLYGARSSYTGRIAVRDWEGRLLKTYWYGTGGKCLVTKGKTTRTASSNEGGMSQPICILVPTGNCPKIGVCSETCDMCTNICAKRFCGWVPFCGIECELPGEPPVGIGSGGVGSTGGGAGGSNSGGGAGPADYPPGCNPDPNYVMPSYPPPGGGTWRLPCGGPETVPIPVPLRLDHNLWTPEETDFLNQNPDIADAITTYLTQNANSEEAKEFVKWAVGYLTVNRIFSDYLKDDIIGDLGTIHDLNDINQFKKLLTLSKDLFTFENQISNGQFDFLSDDWLNHLRIETSKFNQIPKSTAQKIQDRIVEQIDISFVKSLRGTAKNIWPAVDGISEAQKQIEFNNNANHGIAILLWEFATGTGENVRNFTYSQDITKKFLEGRVLKEIFDDFYVKVNELALSYLNFKNRTNPIITGLEFSPDHTSITESINKHINSNLVQFFIGGAVIRYMPASEDGWVEVSVTNYTSRKSLLLHVGENYSRSATQPNRPLSTIQQNFKFNIKIDKAKFY